jgi:hypothetical protein
VVVPRESDCSVAEANLFRREEHLFAGSGVE